MASFEIINYVRSFSASYPDAFEAVCWAVFLLILYIYGRLRRGWWRRMLSASLDYHKFHLAAIQSDRSIDEKTREFAMALLWAVNKQLKSDLKNGGGRALWNSFLGEKTSLNTCGTIFYESSKYSRFIDMKIFKLNDTLLSTFYRIYFLESLLYPPAAAIMDILFLVSLIKKPEQGVSRLYIEMKKEI